MKELLIIKKLHKSGHLSDSEAKERLHSIRRQIDSIQNYIDNYPNNVKRSREPLIKA